MLLFSSALATLSLSIDPESERLECRAEAEAWTQGEEMGKSLQDQGQVRLRPDLIAHLSTSDNDELVDRAHWVSWFL